MEGSKRVFQGVAKLTSAFCWPPSVPRALKSARRKAPESFRWSARNGAPSSATELAYTLKNGLSQLRRRNPKLAAWLAPSRKLQHTHTLAREYLSDGARSQVELLSASRDESLLCQRFFSELFLAPGARQRYPVDSSNFAGSWTSVNDHPVVRRISDCQTYAPGCTGVAAVLI